MVMPPHPTCDVFISYAHADKRWLDRLLQQLKVLQRQYSVEVFSDQDIQLGEDWHARIQANLEQAKVAVLLITPAFLASEYIANSELPVLLRNAKENGTEILPILVKPSLFDIVSFKWPDPQAGPQEFPLKSLQAAGSPSRPLSKMPSSDQDSVLVSVALRLMKILANP